MLFKTTTKPIKLSNKVFTESLPITFIIIIILCNKGQECILLVGTQLPLTNLQVCLPRVRTGHGKPGKSWNLSISVSRPGKSWNFIVGHGKVMENYSVCGT